MGLYENTENGLKLLAGSTLYADAPIGAIQAFGGATAPSGWFICDGSAKSRTDFAELFAVIGTAFGAGDGSTTFNLPDLREAVPKGAGETGQTVGAHVKSGGLALGEFLDVQTHTHSYQHDFGLYAGSGNNRVGDDKIHNDNTGNNTGRSGATTEVKSVGVNYIIKAKQVGLPADMEAKVDEAVKEAFEIRKGTWTGAKQLYPMGDAQTRDRFDISVTFDEPMPDTNYVVVIDFYETRYITIRAQEKSANGFVIAGANTDNNANSTLTRIEWTAIRYPS